MSVRGRFPPKREVLEALPAVGQYVASAILLFQWKRPEPLLDGGMARLVGRFFGHRLVGDLRYDAMLQELARLIVDSRHPRESNWAILDIAALYCRASIPRCGICPLSARCETGHSRVRAGMQE